MNDTNTVQNDVVNKICIDLCFYGVYTKACASCTISSWGHFGYQRVNRMVGGWNLHSWTLKRTKLAFTITAGDSLHPFPPWLLERHSYRQRDLVVASLLLASFGVVSN